MSYRDGLGYRVIDAYELARAARVVAEASWFANEQANDAWATRAREWHDALTDLAMASA